MIPSEYGSAAPTSAKSSRSRYEIDEAAALVDLRPLERAREQLQLRELHALVDVLEDLVHVRAGLDELGGEAQRLRRRVRVLEPPRVGDERDVERLRDLRRQLDAELGQEVANDLAGRRRVRDDEVDRAEARVVVVMVDVDDERRAVRAPPGRARAGSRSRSRARAGRAPAASSGSERPQVVERHPGVLARQRRLAGQVHDRVLAERVERELRREQRPERVAVGVLVRRDEKAVVRADRLATAQSFVVVWGELIRLRLRSVCRAADRCSPFRSSSSRPSGASSSISCDMRTPSSTVGSYSKVSCGVRFILSSVASRNWSTPCADSSPSSVFSRLRSLPSTLTKTFAWRRSVDVSTPVTVTNPIRGSLSSPIASASVSRIASFTRRMRSVMGPFFPRG